MKITVHYDGSIAPCNPGGALGYGSVIKKDGEILHVAKGYDLSNPINTNNISEFRGMIVGLQWLSEHGYADEEIVVYGDNQMTIKQASGEWRAKKGAYIDSYKIARDWITHFTNIKFVWIPREENEEADAVSKEMSAEALGLDKSKKS